MKVNIRNIIRVFILYVKRVFISKVGFGGFSVDYGRENIAKSLFSDLKWVHWKTTQRQPENIQR